MINAFLLKVALLKVSDATDEYGKQRFEITSSKEMMAIPTNITRSEFYEASRSGYFQLISLEVSFMKQVEVAIRFLELLGSIIFYIKARDTF